LRGLRAVIAGLLRLLLTTAAKYAAMRAVSMLRYFESAVGLHRRAVDRARANSGV
jgi:hypothetical protein